MKLFSCILQLLEDLLSEPQPIQEHLDDTAGSSNMQQPASVLEHDRCEGMQMDVTEQNRSVYMESGIHPTYVEMELGTVCSEVVVDNSEVMISGLRKTGKLKNKSCQTQNMLAAVSIGIQANMQESSSNKSEAKLIQSHNVAVQFPEIVVPTFVDHNYSKVSKCIQKRNALKQSTEEDVCHTNVESGSNHHSVVQSCTEVVQVQEENEGSMCSDNSSEDCMSEVSTSNMGNENLEDPDWGESSISMSQSEADDSFQELSVEEDIVGQKKFIVFEACLDNLLMKLICPVCRAAACEIEKKTILGTFVCVKVSCFNGHEILSWESQPLLGRMPAGNLMSAAAVLFSGTTYAHISRFCAYLGVEFIGKTTYYDTQSQYLFPVVQFHWHEQQKELLKDAEGRMIRLGGDGRCDSPGFSAKYCTYTMMDLDTGYILDFAVEQVSEGVASVGLEKIGFERCMRNLISKGMSIGVVATDRHRGIALLMRTQFTDIDHQFDIWHMCKSIRKKIMLAAKQKGQEDLLPWCRSICNHLWWCTATCEGDPVLLMEKWLSLSYHVTDQHSWGGATKYVKCPHEVPVPRGTDKKWLEEGGECHSALHKIVSNTLFIKDLQQTTKFCHTGNLEVFHALLCRYCPKLEHFSYGGMKARTMLAVLDHNANQNREHSVIRCPSSRSGPVGEKRYRIVYPKAKQEWIAKPIFDGRKYDYIYDLMMNVVSAKTGSLSVDPMQVPELPRNIARCERPEKNTVIARLQSRFHSKS
ncbi:uncharacterized protein LOC122814185 [Protopterus annectens]|uniref:uncharacterized protein LOC122814185 n=1 Tax=Protopterus annectens TaxID=7888 RepID=UPI001CFB970D|nr:uncharacterized protein LOC122814185 [Protopterus annectens]